jgi:hypothetical protein
MFFSWAIRADLQRPAHEVALLPVFFNSSEGLSLHAKLLDTSRGPDILLLQGIVADRVSETIITYEGEHWDSHGDLHERLRFANLLLRQDSRKRL